MADLSRLLFYSKVPTFKNTNQFTSTFTIDGTIDSGVSTRTETINLGFEPITADVLIGVGGEWSKDVDGRLNPIEVSGNGSISGSTTTNWSIGAEISGSNLIITAFTIWTVNETVTLTAKNVSVKLVDYSAIEPSDPINFSSDFNYMKRIASDTVSLSLGGAGATTTKNISHDFDGVPFYAVGGELNNGSILWSNNRVHRFTESTQSGDNSPQFWTQVNSSRLQINLVNGFGDGQQSGTRDFTYVIYGDY